MDLKVIETGNGGDIVKNPKDLALVFGFENMVYMALFGGNVEQSTPLTREDGEQDFSWWGNKLFFENDLSLQMNSETERALNNTALNSFGLKVIENAVKKDLNFMKEFADVEISVSMEQVNRIAIEIKVTQIDAKGQQKFMYVWDATNRSLSAEQ
jgi:hypothetical protein